MSVFPQNRFQHRVYLITLSLALCPVAIAQVKQPAAGQRDKVLFSSDQPPASVATKSARSIDTVSDTERNSLTFTAYDLDAHLIPAKSQLSVRAKLTVRNVGTEPLTDLAFQLSSSLNWESFEMRSGDHVVPLAFAQHLIDTDTDHTGQAKEAIVTLPQPLAPNATVELTTFYSGEIQQSAKRLERIGAPPDQAAAADWDKIAPDSTALRGFGNVLWYPTASAPALLGDGAKLFQLVGKTRLQQAAATIHLRLAVEYIGNPPDAAFFCGQRKPMVAVNENVDAASAANQPGVATADFPSRPLGFRSASLFLTAGAATTTDGNQIAAVTDHYDTVPTYAAAAIKVQPLLKEWLGPTPLTTLNIIDHNGQPFEDDSLLVAPMRAVDPDTLAPALVHSLTHAWFRSSHVWLDEGVPQFMSLLWVEHTQGRDVALQQLQQQVNTLALAEPAPSENADLTLEGQSLIRASDEIYYRTKAAAVLWMLQSIVGNDALKQALQSYRQSGSRDDDPKEFQHVLEQSSHKDLNWFFNDWVYHDRGLPDLTIANVTPRQLPAQGLKAASFLVAIEIRNNGDAAAEVPVTVRSGALTTTERLRIMGRSSASTRIVFEGTPSEVMVNDGSVPEIEASTHTKQLVMH
ncbi:MULTISPECIES: M1 family aminopeptidase [Acidobacteriaceae]|uniref:M1 family aminopeptidase n=1 Tax=Acidobacteriaceae TaxID=204434 RepID=UPI00131DFA61|nr:MULTISPECIES: M1 family aminopeptidase [Acidobacteriaceae]MDW5264622.1 M1 family aminopeptidase [Edaphobacter sp.]